MKWFLVPVVLSLSFLSAPLRANPEEEVVETLRRLTSEDASIHAEALASIQRASQLDRRLRATGFAFVPSQIEEVRVAFQRITDAWRQGEISLSSLRDAKKMVGILTLLNRVRADIQKAIPRQEVGVVAVGSAVFVTVRETMGGPIALVKAARSVTWAYRNHSGSRPLEPMEKYFRQPNQAIYADDFNHYSFARQLGLIEALEMADSLTETPADLREALVSLWFTSFIETALQMRGLQAAKESPILIKVLYQTWAAHLRRSQRFDAYLSGAFDTINQLHQAGTAPSHEVAAALESMNALLAETLKPTRPLTYGLIAGRQSGIVGAQANGSHLVSLMAYLEAMSSNTDRTGNWLSATTAARGAAFVCSIPAQCRATAIYPFVKAATLSAKPFGAVLDFFHTPATLESKQKSRCEDLVKKIAEWEATL